LGDVDTDGLAVVVVGAAADDDVVVGATVLVGASEGSGSMVMEVDGRGRSGAGLPAIGSQAAVSAIAPTATPAAITILRTRLTWLTWLLRNSAEGRADMRSFRLAISRPRCGTRDPAGQQW
jgi:hypothetical protein